jgi:DNA-binding GntR family transcriptional regulator
MDDALATVMAEPLRDRAEAALRDAILGGRLLPGTRLIEAQLADRLGVSRGTLRQALRELEHAGLVVSTPYRGTYVAEQSPHALQDAYSLRGVLEGFAATQIPAVALPRLIDRQRSCLAQMQEALAEGRFSDVAAIDVEFHAPICVAAGNERLRQVWASLSMPLQARYANDVESLYSPAEIILRHEALIALVQSGESNALETGIRLHYLETARRMTAAMQTPGGSGRQDVDDRSSPGGAP